MFQRDLKLVPSSIYTLSKENPALGDGISVGQLPVK